MNWHVYIFLTAVWNEIIETEQYALPSHRRATQSSDGVYTQIVGELPEEIASQSYKPFGDDREFSKAELDEWKASVRWHPVDELDVLE